MIEIRDPSDKRTALLVVILSHFLMPFMGASVNVALPSIGRDFSIDAILLNWIATIYFLSSVMFLIPFGKIADIHGRKRIFIYGLAVFTLGSFFCGVAPSAGFLIAARFLQGIGAAMVFSTGVAIIASVSPAAERGKALGLNVAVVYLGQTVGPFLGGALTQNFGWRSIFYAAVPVSLLVILLVLWKLKGEWVESKQKKYNYGSTIIFSLSLLLIIYGFSVVPEKSSLFFLSAGIISFLYFIRHETQADNPLVDIDLFRKNRVFSLSNLATFISFSATYATIFLLSLYLQYIQMLTPQGAGLVLMSKAIMQGIVSPVAGSLSDRFEPRKLASLGMGLQGLSLFLFALIDFQTSLVFVVFLLMILGLGIGLFMSPNTNAIISSVGKENYGISSATLATMRQTGSLFSMAIIMSIFALSIGRVEITPQYYGAFLTVTKRAFLLYGVICCCGVFASLVRGNLPKPGMEKEQNL